MFPNIYYRRVALLTAEIRADKLTSTTFLTVSFTEKLRLPKMIADNTRMMKNQLKYLIFLGVYRSVNLDLKSLMVFSIMLVLLEEWDDELTDEDAT